MIELLSSVFLSACVFATPTDTFIVTDQSAAVEWCIAGDYPSTFNYEVVAITSSGSSGSSGSEVVLGSVQAGHNMLLIVADYGVGYKLLARRSAHDLAPLTNDVVAYAPINGQCLTDPDLLWFRAAYKEGFVTARQFIDFRRVWLDCDYTGEE